MPRDNTPPYPNFIGTNSDFLDFAAPFESFRLSPSTHSIWSDTCIELSETSCRASMNLIPTTDAVNVGTNAGQASVSPGSANLGVLSLGTFAQICNALLSPNPSTPEPAASPKTGSSTVVSLVPAESGVNTPIKRASAKGLSKSSTQVLSNSGFPTLGIVPLPVAAPPQPAAAPILPVASPMFTPVPTPPKLSVNAAPTPTNPRPSPAAQ